MQGIDLSKSASIYSGIVLLAPLERDICRTFTFAKCGDSGSAGARHFQDMNLLYVWCFQLRRSATFSGFCLFPGVVLPPPERDIFTVFT